MSSESLVDHALKLAGIKPGDVRFVILDGSTAEGSNRKYSDYDVLVVRKGLSKQPGSIKDLFGVFNGRLVSGWLLDEESFKHRYVGDDDQEFLWRRKQLRKAKLLFGDRIEFNKIVGRALARRWNRKRQVAVIRYSYVTMVEYMGKMLNKVRAHEDDAPEFYQDGYVIATNAALLVAALNKIDLDSDKIMYRQIFAQAKIRPPNFEDDFETASGFADTKREKEAVLSASRRLYLWSRKAIIDSFEPLGDDDSGFWQIARETKF